MRITLAATGRIRCDAHNSRGVTIASDAGTRGENGDDVT